MAQAQEKLSQINRWETTLETTGVSSKRFEQTLEFYENSSEKKADYFSKQIGSTYVKENNFYRVYLPKSVNLGVDTFLLYICDEWNKESQKEAKEQHDKVLIIGKDEELKNIRKLAIDKTNRLIAPRQEQLTEFLLSDDSEAVLVKVFADCLLLKDISPYQVNSGVTNESNFFGRVEIIRDIISKENANYIIVGARQLGKSSIIKALERRYEGSSKIECYSFTMEDENIIAEMATALGMSVDASLDDVVATLSTAKKKSIFLIDEADKFVKNEKKSEYRVTEAFRKLSQEGKATFVLTGFWTLYFSVTSDYHSPLKNFGELIKLEGLDEEACRDLMREPMKRIGVSYEDESIVENLITLCGKRPNLIAITCNEVLKNLEGKVISQKDIDEVVENSSLEEYLKGWGSMSSNAEDNQLDRVIIYLTLEQESFRLADVVEMLKERGVEVNANRIKESLERLVVGYLLHERKNLSSTELNHC